MAVGNVPLRKEAVDETPSINSEGVYENMNPINDVEIQATNTSLYQKASHPNEPNQSTLLELLKRELLQIQQHNLETKQELEKNKHYNAKTTDILKLEISRIKNELLQHNLTNQKTLQELQQVKNDILIIQKQQIC